MDKSFHTRPLRVASYNIRKCVGLDWRRRPDRIAGILHGLDADVIALQEADKRLGRRPAALPAVLFQDAGRLRVAPVAGNSTSLGWHGNAVLLDEALGVSDITRLPLPGLEPRGAAIVEAEAQGRPIRIVATHLGLLRRDRRKQIDTIVNALTARPNRPTIIMGDMNEWAQDKGLEPLNAGFTTHSPGHSFHAARPIAGLDRIAHCSGFALAAAGVIETPETRTASDHLPVWADLHFT